MLKKTFTSILLIVSMLTGLIGITAGAQELVIDVSTATITSSPTLYYENPSFYNTSGIIDPDEFGPSKAFDGDLDTPWQPLANPKGMWLRLEFQEPVSFNSAGIYELINYDKNRFNVTKFQLQYSDDGEIWNVFYSGDTIGERLGIDFETVTTKYVRLVIMGTDTEHPRIGEIKLFYKSEESVGSEVIFSEGAKSVVINGTENELEQAPLLEKGKLMVPLDFFSDVFGLKYEWDENKREAKVTDNKNSAKTYYVSISGNDENPGTLEQPFRTIQRAADTMKAGDTCLVREGIYRETVIPKNSGEKGKPMKFAAYPGEKVTVSGAEVLEGEWELHDGQIYKMPFDQKVTQLFVNEDMYNIARWPNAQINNVLEREQYAVVEAGDYGFVKSSALPNANLSGAILHIWPGEAWNGFEAEVTQGEGKQLDLVVPFLPKSNSLDLGDPWQPKYGNKFYIYGVLPLLDIAGEWVQDKADNSIYLWTESGDPSTQVVERKVRNWAFDIVDKSFITIEGFNIFSSAIRVRASDNCIINDCRILYPSDDHKKSVIISGDNNIIKKSHIAYTPGDGVILYGNNNQVDNCIIHDINSYGDLLAAVQTSGVGNKITNNTMYKSGRSLVLHYYSRKMTIENNIIRTGGILAKDLGATYSYGHNNNDGSQGSIIAYNWVLDMGSEVGIYLDSYSRGYSVHHNVVDGCNYAMVMNGGGIDNKIYNNTFLNENFALFSITFVGMELTQKGSSFINNIWSGATMFVSGPNAPEVRNNVSARVDSNYIPLKSSAAVDKGAMLPGFTDEFAGKAPDIGAYELGGVYWKPGANWSIED